MNLLSYALLFLLILSQPANAAAVGAFIAAAGAAFKAAVTIKAITALALRTLISTGISKLVQRFKQRKQRSPGIQTPATTSGGTDPQGTVLGRFATSGHLDYQNSYGPNLSTLTYVVEVGDLPGANLRRLIIDGEYTEISTVWDPLYGYSLLSKAIDGHNRAWIRFYDGTQTGADSRLVEIFGEDPERPWTNDHILTGIPYAVLTFEAHQETFPNGRPEVRFELDGPSLYDPRQDGTAGGNGAQRWSDPATWQPTENLMVIAYNVMRGLTLPCGSVWGGGFPAEDLPYTEWAAAMDACDLGVGNGNRPQFRGGMEVRFEEAPVDFLEEVFAAANAEILELGGYWYPLVGSVDTIAADLSEGDLLVSEGWQHDPFPGLENTFNAVTITHTSPNALWNAAAPITLTKPDWEAEDGGERVFDLNLPMVFNAQQARQLGNALLKENRRFRTHRLPLPPEYSNLRPLLKTRFTSDWYGYDNKTFTITEMAFDLLTLNVSVSLREWDHNDFDPDLTLEIPDTVQVTGPVSIEDAGVPGFGVTGVAIKDVHGVVRSAGIRAEWHPALANTTDGVSFQARVKDGDDERFSASTGDVELGSFRLEPMRGGTEYEVRARALARTRSTTWTAWLPVTTPVFQVQPDDLSEEITDIIDGAQDAADAAAADATTALEDAAAARADINGLLNGYSGATLQQSLDDIRTRNEADIAPIGGSVLRPPAALWTLKGTSSASGLTKPAVTASDGVFLSDDPDFGECWEFASNANPVLGPAFPADFKAGRVYKVSVLAKCVDDGTSGGARVSISGTTQRGVSMLQSNIQLTVADPLAVADGVQEFTVYFSTDQAALDSYGLTSSDYKVVDPVSSAGANKIYFHVRQNRGQAHNGILRIGSIYITDVTEALAGVNALRTALKATTDALAATLEDIKAVAIDELAGTALATLFSQLQVNANGTSAKVTEFQAAKADLDGFAQAFAGLTAETNDGNIAGLRLTSFSNPDGSGGGLVELLGAVIAEQSLATNRLLIGIGKNRLENPDFTQGLVGADPFTNNAIGSTGTVSVRKDGSYSTTFYPTLRLQTLIGSISADGNVGVGFKPVENDGTPGIGYPVEAGAYYEFSAALSIRRARVSMRIYWYKEDGTKTDEIGSGYREVADETQATSPGDQPPQTWTRYGDVKKAPDDAAYAVPDIRLIETANDNGVQDIHIFQPMFAEAAEGAALSPYSPGTNTYIDGGRLVANSITAAKGVIAELAVGRLNLATGAVTELVRLSATDSTSVAYGSGTRSTATHNMNVEFAANGTANMHKVSSATLTYNVPSSNPPEKLLIQPSVRMGMSFWDWANGSIRAYNMVAGIKVKVENSEALGWLVPSNNYSFYKTHAMSMPLMYDRPDVLLELGTDYSAGDTIKFEVFIYRGDLSGSFQFGFDMREHTVDILEFYK